MTLIEVIVGAVILGILAIMASTAFFYPRLLVVNSGLEQSAIHAGIGKIERNLHSIDSTLDQFNTDGWPLQNVTTNFTPHQEDVVGGAIDDEAKYLEIEVKVDYRDGKPPVEFITYRSLEVLSNQR